VRRRFSPSQGYRKLERLVRSAAARPADDDGAAALYLLLGLIVHDAPDCGTIADFRNRRLMPLANLFIESWNIFRQLARQPAIA
jgi:hypothetical protein